MKAIRITREIGIDAGHRIPNHDSKCKSLHGHRYVIQATVEGALGDHGSTEGMAGSMDFSFLKKAMMDEIDTPCDHGMILWMDDPIYLTLTSSPSTRGKIYILDSIPTAENLAQHWFNRLVLKVKELSEGRAKLVHLRVYETPNCWADVYGG